MTMQPRVKQAIHEWLLGEAKECEIRQNLLRSASWWLDQKQGTCAVCDLIQYRAEIIVEGVDGDVTFSGVGYSPAHAVARLTNKARVREVRNFEKVDSDIQVFALLRSIEVPLPAEFLPTDEEVAAVYSVIDHIDQPA